MGWAGAREGEAGLRAAAGLALALLVSSSPVAAQSPLRPAMDPPPLPGSPTQRVIAGPEYRAGGLARLFLGDGYRDLWTTPIGAPVLDLEMEAGGLRPIRVGGGFQTQTLHLRGGDDGYYLFRSVNKAVRRGLPDDLRDTPAGHLVQDQTSALHPAGAWVVPRLLEALEVPRERPELFIMPDDPRLGEHREAFAGVLGMLVKSPDQGESGELSWAGSDEILGSEDLLERLEASPADRVDSRTLLASRLVDLLVGDPDRNFDNYRWLGYREGRTTVWRPVPMDRDPAFLKADGLIAAVARRTFLPKYVEYGPEFDHASGLWASQHEMDRLLLSDLGRPVWDSLVAEVRERVTDGVISEAVASLPPEYRPESAEFLVRSLRSRRDRLASIAERLYRDLAHEVDIQGTAASEVAEVIRHGDGSAEVLLHGGCTPLVAEAQDADARELRCRDTFYGRSFTPGETREVRIYLRAGDDRGIVRGEGPQPIKVRVIGGEGDDLLEDGSRPDGPSRTAFYDHEGDNRLLPGRGTRVDTRDWGHPVITDFVFEKESGVEYQDWGSSTSWTVAADYEQSAGPVLKVGRSRRVHGFRAVPWSRRVDVGVLLGLAGGGAELEVHRRLEGTGLVLSGSVHATSNLWSYRFSGFGNDTPILPSELTLVPSDEVRIESRLALPLGRRGDLRLGPVIRYLRPEPDPRGPLAEGGDPGGEPFGQVGARVSLRVGATDDDDFPRLGITLRGSSAAYAPVWDAPAWFGRSEVDLRGYLPLPERGALAARLGGEMAWGRIPAHEAAFLGGRRSLRGFRQDRFAGHRAIFGSAELRVPVGRLTLLTAGEMGVLGLGDAGRVWVGADSPGGWHTSYGGGLWYRTLGVTGTVAWARGEVGRGYLYLGLPF